MCDGLSKTRFLQTIVDSSNIQCFRIDTLEKDIHEACIITIYKTKVKTRELLGNLVFRFQKAEFSISSRFK